MEKKMEILHSAPIWHTGDVKILCWFCYFCGFILQVMNNHLESSFF